MANSAAIGAAARIPNPALAPLAFLLGEWRTEGRHPAVPGETLRGRTAFAWHEGGAFLIMRSEIDHPLFPSGIAIFGSDDQSGAVQLIYFDERKLSRHYAVALGDRSVSWRRDHPEFSQVMTIAAGGDGAGLVGSGRMSRAGGPWEDDLSQLFTRVGPAD